MIYYSARRGFQAVATPGSPRSGSCLLALGTSPGPQPQTQALVGLSHLHNSQPTAAHPGDRHILPWILLYLRRLVQTQPKQLIYLLRKINILYNVITRISDLPSPQSLQNRKTIICVKRHSLLGCWCQFSTGCGAENTLFLNHIYKYTKFQILMCLEEFFKESRNDFAGVP